jgi:hypothetical protein
VAGGVPLSSAAEKGVTATPHGMAQDSWRAGSEGKEARLARTAIAAARVWGFGSGGAAKREISAMLSVQSAGVQ